MAEHPNATLIRNLLSASGPGAMVAAIDALAEDVVVEIPGSSPISGTYEGRDAVLGFWGRLAGLADGQPRSELLHVLTGGDRHAVAVWRSSVSRKGRQLDTVLAYVFELRDWKIVRATNLQADPDEVDAFWPA